MTDPTPPRREPEFDYTARLAPITFPPPTPAPTSWFVTFGFGKPAASTYTEVAFDLEALTDPDADGAAPHPEYVLDAVVRRVTVDLYGQAWAFHYRPDQYDEAIARHGVRLRERVVVSSIEVWT